MVQKPCSDSTSNCATVLCLIALYNLQLSWNLISLEVTPSFLYHKHYGDHGSGMNIKWQ
jgi:hypothetical protein